MIEIDNLVFGYNKRPLFKGISVKIEKGEFVGIIGPNGAGKSTLLRLLAGTLRLDQGSIRLKGSELRAISQKERAKIIGFIPQETHFSLGFKVFDIVLQGRYPHLGFFRIETDEDIEIAREALKKTGVLHLAEENVLKISSGERQLAVIARAIAQQPEILLSDEPTSFLDIHHQIEIMTLFKNLNQEGLTIVVVVHDLNLAALFCQRLILISNGEIINSGPPEEILKKDLIETVYKVNVVEITHPVRRDPQIILNY